MRYLVFLVCILFSGLLQAQATQPSNDAGSHSLMLSFDYSTNTNTLGDIDGEIKQPSLSPSLALFTRWGIDLWSSTNFTDHSDDSLQHFSAEFDIALGYNLKLFKNLTLYPSYTRYLYSKNANSFLCMFNQDIRLDMDYSYKHNTTGLSAGYMNGSQHTFYGSIRDNYQIYISRFAFRTTTLAIQPGVDLNFGSYKYLYLYYLDQLSAYDAFYLYLLRHSPGLRRYVYIEKYKNPGATVEEIMVHYMEQRVDDQFNLTSVSLNLPLMIVYGNFSINAGIYALIPLNAPDYLSNDPQFFINVGLTWLLDFRKR